MTRPLDHPLAWFALEPINLRAKKVLNHPENHTFVSLSDGIPVLAVGHVRSKSGNMTLATLGRGDADIFVEGSSIARIQCSFEINPATNVVMFYDRSHGQSTQVFGQNSTPFENGRVRKVVVQKGFNTIIGMGGVKRNLVQFELRWCQAPEKIIEKIKSRECSASEYEEHPRLARTIIDDTDTVLQSRRETRIHTPGSRQLKMRYITMNKLGFGQFGEVSRALDIDSGRPMAIKILKQPLGTTQREREAWKRGVHYALKREVEHLSRIDHPHIVNYITSQGWDGTQVEIFMGLQEGNLESLIESGCSPVPEDVFHQMLQALDCLTSADIIHRDVKPENILWTTIPNGTILNGTIPNGKYHFRLGDFGLSNCASSACTRGIGTPIYAAPEVWERGKQSTKADIWSLYVTMLWVIELGFRQACLAFTVFYQVRATVLESSNQEPLLRIRRMADPDPVKRASAAEMLVECFGGAGQVTSRAAAAALTDIRPTKKPKEVYPFQHAPQHRIGRARHPPRVPNRVTDGRVAEATRLRMPGAFPSNMR